MVWTDFWKLAVVLSFSSLTASKPLLPRDTCKPVSQNGFREAPGYIVAFDTSAKYSMDDHFKKIGQKFKAEVYPEVAYWADLTQEKIKAVCSDPNVIEISHNAYGRFTALPKGIDNHTLRLETRQTQDNAGWALAYLSEKSKSPKDETYHHLATSGKDVNIYIVDSGVNDGPEFGGRLFHMKDYSGNGHQDEYNHGTSVASVAGGSNYGSAKQPNILAYKVTNKAEVLDAGNTLQALRDIVADNRERRGKPGYKGAVINISADIPGPSGIANVIENAVAQGISVVVAAGNEGVNVNGLGFDHANCKIEDVLCVGAIDRNYKLANFKTGGTNYGKSISLFAPGKDIRSIDNKMTVRDDFEGSSYASPYVAGIIATYYGVEGTNMRPEKANNLLLMTNSERGVLEAPLLGNSPNILANNGYQKADGGKPYIGAPDGSGSSSAPTTQSAGLKCTGVGTSKWLGRDTLNDQIPKFCEDAAKQGTQDKNSGAVTRTYLPESNDAVLLAMDWLPGSNFKPNKDECVKYMKQIMDNCDGNQPEKNPFNWKAGGSIKLSNVQYRVEPQKSRYVPGICSFHVNEKVSWRGFDEPGLSRHWKFELKADVKDGNGKTLGGTDGKHVEAGKDGGNPYVYKGLYAPLEMTPEAQNGDYIQFTIADDHWMTKDLDQNRLPRCSVGDYTTTQSPKSRDMDCSFKC